MTTAMELPKVLLARILQHVPLQQRLSSCALVCRDWAAVAVTATSSISFSTHQSRREDSKIIRLKKWLQQHDQSVFSFDLTLTQEGFQPEDRMQSDEGGGTESCLADCLQLPQHLTRLCLNGVPLQSLSTLPHNQQQQQQEDTGGSSSSSGIAALLPQLVELKLVDCTKAKQADLQQLVCATGLTKLHVEQLQIISKYTYGGGGCRLLITNVGRMDVTAHAVGPALQACSNLVALTLVSRNEMLDPPPFASLSGLTRLQELHIKFPYDVPADFLPRLPSSIRSLSLDSTISNSKVGSVVQAALQQIPQLQHLQSLSLHMDHTSTSLDATTLSSMTQVRELQLHSVRFDVRGLGSMTQLQQLVLKHCSLLRPASAEPASSEQYAQAGEGDAAVRAAALLVTSRAVAESLLSAVSQLTQLQVLEVSYARSEISDRVAAAYGRLYGRLPSLEPVGLVLHHAPAQAFSALTASSKLQRLHLDGTKDAALPKGAAEHMFPAGRQLTQLTALELSSEHLDFRAQAHGCLGEEDLHSICSSCPRLRALHIQGLVEGARQTQPPLGASPALW